MSCGLTDMLMSSDTVGLTGQGGPVSAGLNHLHPETPSRGLAVSRQQAFPIFLF